MLTLSISRHNFMAVLIDFLYIMCFNKNDKTRANNPPKNVEYHQRHTFMIVLIDFFYIICYLDKYYIKNQLHN